MCDQTVNLCELGSIPSAGAIFLQLTEFDPLLRATATYALDRGAPKFDIIETKSKKDQHYNLAVQQAQAEFENLKQIADVINKQAQQIKERLEITELVHNA